MVFIISIFDIKFNVEVDISDKHLREPGENNYGSVGSNITQILRVSQEGNKYIR